MGRGSVDPLPLVLAGHEDGIHDLRVAARRFRAALPLLAQRPSRRRIRNVITLLRRLGDIAGLARDYDVMWGLLSAHPEQEGVLAPLASRLRVQRLRARRLLAEDLRLLDLHVVQGAIGAVTAEEPEPLFLVLVRVGQRRDELARDIAARLATAHVFRPDPLHRLRIRIRRLRYLIEMQAEIRGVRPQIGVVKELQDVLGAVQDAWVFSRWLRREASLARRRGDRAFADRVRLEAGWWAALAREHHARFLSLEPAAGIREAVAALGGTRRHGSDGSISGSRDVRVTIS